MIQQQISGNGIGKTSGQHRDLLLTQWEGSGSAPDVLEPTIRWAAYRRAVATTQVTSSFQQLYDARAPAGERATHHQGSTGRAQSPPDGQHETPSNRQ